MKKARIELTHIIILVAMFTLFTLVIPRWLWWATAIILLQIDNSWRRYNEKVEIGLTLKNGMNVMMETSLSDAYRLIEVMDKGNGNEDISAE